jgi:hypothetical protein
MVEPIDPIQTADGADQLSLFGVGENARTRNQAFFDRAGTSGKSLFSAD